MIRTTLLLAASAAILCACASGGELVWARSGATQQDFDQDMGQCTAQAWSVSNAGGAQLLMVQQSCMQGKGWHRTARQ